MWLFIVRTQQAWKYRSLKANHGISQLVSVVTNRGSARAFSRWGSPVFVRLTRRASRMQEIVRFGRGFSLYAIERTCFGVWPFLVVEVGDLKFACNCNVQETCLHARAAHVY